MDSERVQNPVQDEDTTLLGLEAQNDEMTAEEVQTHTEAVFEQMFSQSDILTEEIPKENIDQDAGISTETDQALVELERQFESSGDSPDDDFIKNAQARESRYHDRIVAQDKALEKTSGHTYHGKSLKNDHLIAAWSRIKSSKAYHQILREEATIVSAEEFRTRNGDIQILAGCELSFSNNDGTFTHFHAYMKLDELFLNPPARIRRGQAMTDQEYRSRCKMQVSYMIGASIPVIVTQALYTGDVSSPFQIVVSRREALLQEIVSFYARNPETDEARTNIGNIVTGKVVSVGAYNVVVNVRGVDCTVSAIDLTCRPVTDCRKEFAVNDVVEVEIMDISWPDDARHKVMLLSDYEELKQTMETARKNSAEYRRSVERLRYNCIINIPKVEINGSRYEATKLYNMYSSEIRIGTLTTAIVENVSYNEQYNRPSIRVYLDKFQLVGYARSVNFSRIVGALEPGAHVTFMIDGVNQKNTPFLNGRIMNIIPTKD